MLAERETFDTIQEKLECSRTYITRWKSRFLRDGLAGLFARHRGRKTSALTPAEIESLRVRLDQQAVMTTAVRLTRADYLGALGVFLLVFASTFPIIVPLIVVKEMRLALGLSNAVAVLMLFIAGWTLGRHAGRPAWRSGLGMVAVGIGLVALTVALGG